jgi:hypothetical protein
MGERADDRFQQIRRLREALGALNPQQTGTYQRWIGNAQKHSLQLDLKHCLFVATTIAKGLPRHRESDEIICLFRSLPKLSSEGAMCERGLAS